LQENLEDERPTPYQHVWEVQVTPELFHVPHEAVLKFEEKSETLKR
jgi:hypothetical protein